MATAVPWIDRDAPGRAALERALAFAVSGGAPTEGVTSRRERKERHTTHHWIEVDDGGVVRRYFVKRYQPPIGRNLLTFVLPSRVRREYRNSRLAAQLGLPVLAAVGFSERRRFGIVVDQWIAFEDVGRCRSATQLLERAKQGDRYEALRLDLVKRIAKDLRTMHEAGYSHLAMSPRNYLKLVDEQRFVFIDHNAAVTFDHSIHATKEAVPDLLNLFDSRKLFPDDGARSEFLTHYAPDARDFCSRVLRERAEGVRSDRAARAQKLRAMLGL